MKLRHVLPAAALAAAACGKTDECRRLEASLQEHENSAKDLRARAQVNEKLEKSAQAAEAEARQVLEKLGFEMTEEQTNAALGQRAGAIEKAKIERKAITPDPTPENTARKSQTMWVVEFDEKDPEKAFAHVKALCQQPPFLLLSTLVKEKGQSRWRVELLRGDVDRVTIKPEPLPVPTPEAPDTIASQLGFCGASDTRAKIAKLRQEIDRLKPEAGKTTVLLPTKASWEGLRFRAEHENEKEQEVRRHVSELFEAARKAKVELKAIGYEEPLVILEVWGGKPERKRLETAMGPAMLGQVKDPPLDVTKPGVVRLSMIVEAAREGGPKRTQGPRPGPSIPFEALPKKKKEGE